MRKLFDEVVVVGVGGRGASRCDAEFGEDVTGFITEFAGYHQDNGEGITDRKILLAEVRAGRISELTICCSGDWNAELRARHVAETQLIRP